MNTTNTLNLTSLPEIHPPFEIKCTLIEDSEKERIFEYTCQGAKCMFEFTKIGFPLFTEAQQTGEDFARGCFALIHSLTKEKDKC